MRSAGSRSGPAAAPVGRAGAGLLTLLRAPATAAFLSFLFPGLGQAAAGRLRRAVVVAVPALVVTGGALRLLIFNRHAIVGAVFQRDLLTAFLVLVLVALAYHLWAIVDAYVVAGGSFRPRRWAAGRLTWIGPVMVAVVLLTTVGIHGEIAVADTQGLQVLSDAFGQMPQFLAANPSESPEDTTPPVPIVTPTPATWAMPLWTPAPTVTPSPPPRDWADDDRLNLLIIGTDAGQGRIGLRPDSMILLTVELSTGRAAMIGMPRNMLNVPLPQPEASLFACHCFPGMLNELYLEAMAYPNYFPGGDQRGFKAMEGAIGTLTGLKVDGTVLVNLMGFVNLIDAVGPLYINVPYEVVDKPGMEPGYEGYVPPEGVGHVSFDIKPGWQYMDGHVALEYARTRAQDWDYSRMQRQQIVLLALRKQFEHPCSLIGAIPTILQAMTKNGGMFWTDMPIESASDLLAVAEHVGADSEASITLDPATTGAVWNAAHDNADTLNPNSIANIRYIAKHALDKVTASASGGVSLTAGFSC
jgi:LCP family protein required for cell wall assembly